MRLYSVTLPHRALSFKSINQLGVIALKFLISDASRRNSMGISEPL